MIKKILIANRGEIAVRIIKAAKELGISTVTVYSDIDKNTLHRRLSDFSVNLPGLIARETYLDGDKIIKIALDTGCDAIHPGYGFLSENHNFNQKTRDAGLIFIGPNPESMRLLGSKTESRELMIRSGVPVVPGIRPEFDAEQEIGNFADQAGYPILIKAASGGGGKGMRIVPERSKLKESVESARREALSAFGSEEIFAEKYIESPRHIEFQIAADSYGNYIHLNERECSIQRRHQKIIEESPSIALDDKLRNEMGEIAVKAVNAAAYDNIGTVEFLLDKNGKYYFLEVNARVQVEHPITELVTGIDLVKLQIEIASGKELPFIQSDISSRGHAIECRIYAEDPDNNFLPSSGKILFLKEPAGSGIRLDTGIVQGDEVSVYYDPILSKLISYGATREEARLRIINALNNYVILGIQTPIEFLSSCFEHQDFIGGSAYTDFVEKNKADLIKTTTDAPPEAYAIAISLKSGFDSLRVDNELGLKERSVWEHIGSWELMR